ncbi:hypothetical protein CCP4SC76_5790002 [Gammaproteobacteria bacterium]
MTSTFIYPRKSPRPLVGVRHIEQLLLRHTINTSPEARLVVAVICQALLDARSLSLYNRRKARRFLLGRGLEHCASLVGLEREFVMEVITKTGYLPKPNPANQRRKKSSVITSAPDSEPFISGLEAWAEQNNQVNQEVVQ